jgi:hypothetical protein
VAYFVQKLEPFFNGFSIMEGLEMKKDEKEFYPFITI